jgi:DNA modification methylase
MDRVTYELHHHDARHVSTLLAPESVDLIVTSPPYFALRSYRDGGEHYDGQVGSEPTPGEFVDALIACTADWLRVLKPTGSLWVNLGDKYSGSGGHNNNGIGSSTLQSPGRPYIEKMQANQATRRNAPDRYSQSSDGIPAKSLMGLPWRYALRCIDELGLILRAEIIWSKPNGLPESVADRVRRSHEQWFHFTRQGRYFAAIDEVREPSDPGSVRPHFDGSRAATPKASRVAGSLAQDVDRCGNNPLGKAPGSVWTIPSEPLVVPDDLGVDHFAAFPSEWPRRIILGWSPSGYCTACGEARRAVVDSHAVKSPVHGDGSIMGNRNGGPDERGWDGLPRFDMARTITGYACACPAHIERNGAIVAVDPAPTRAAVVLDPFAGTGTTVAVAHLLGRHGIGTDLSRDYLRLAEWRCSSDQRLRDKVLDRTGIPNPKPPAIDGQLGMFDEDVA